MMILCVQLVVAIFVFYDVFVYMFPVVCLLLSCFVLKCFVLRVWCCCVCVALCCCVLCCCLLFAVYVVVSVWVLLMLSVFVTDVDLLLCVPAHVVIAFAVVCVLCWFV